MTRHGLRIARHAWMALVLLHGCKDEASKEQLGEAAPSSASQPSAPDSAASPGPADAPPPARKDDTIAEQAEQAPPTGPSLLADPSLAARPSRIAIGRTHVCVLDGSNHPVCWGDAREGRLGTASPESDHHVLADLTAASLAAGESHTCGLVASGDVMCWGSDAHEQLGVDGDSTPTPTRLPFDGVARQLTAGGETTCAVLEGGTLWCRRPEGRMQRIDAIDPARAAMGPGGEGCVLDTKGTASCWKWPSGLPEPKANVVEGLPPSVDVGVGDRFACALGADRQVRCWGSNEGQRLGRPPVVADGPAPAVVPELPGDIVQLAVGERSSCALQEGGVVWCWGVNGEGQLGRGELASSGAAARVQGLDAATAVAVSHDRACALVKDGTPWCWGVGPGTPVTPATQIEPAQLVALSDLVQCATMTDGRTWCWEHDRDEPAAVVEGVKGATSMALPDGGGCVVVDGGVRCWGEGAITAGNPELDPEDPTVYSIAGDDVTSLFAIMQRVCAIGRGGKVWCWGMSDPPDGSGDLLAYGPTTVIGLTNAQELALSRFGPDCALRADGTVACWSPARPSSPKVVSRATPLAGMPPAIAIAGEQTVCALTQAGEVWCTHRETGQPQQLRVQLPGPADTIAMAIRQSCVRFEDRTVGCWSNEEAERVAAPITVAPIHGLADVVQLLAKANRVCALRKDGTTACWGALPPRLDVVPARSTAFESATKEE